MIKIRKASVKDLNLLNKFHKEYDRYERSLDKRVRICSTKQNLEIFNKFLKNNTVEFIFASIDHEPVGLIEIEKRKDLGLIHNLVVAKSARGNGIGAKLVKYAELSLKKQGCKRMRSYIRIKNTKAQEFWKKQGYFFRKRAQGYRIRKTLK